MSSRPHIVAANTPADAYDAPAAPSAVMDTEAHGLEARAVRRIGWRLVPLVPLVVLMLMVCYVDRAVA